MSSDLLSIGASGARAARVALDVTAQNIANAATQGYVRRSAELHEVARASGVGNAGDISLSGVRVSGLTRAVDLFRAAETRRTASDAARAQTEVRELENLESAIEQSGLFDAVVQFEGSLQALAGYPVDPSLRSAALAAADQLAGTFNIAASGIAAAAGYSQAQAQAEVDRINVTAAELARINAALPRAGPASAEAAYLLDQRDMLLSDLVGSADIAVSIDSQGMASVTLGGAMLVDRVTTAPLAMTTAANGTVSFAVGGNAVAIAGGSLAGRALALDRAAGEAAQLDAIAADLITRLNAVQTNGVALDGSPGQPLFSGTGAADMAVSLGSGAGLATAPAGAGAGSRDAANIHALQAALGTGGADVAGRVNAQTLDLSSRIAARKVTSEALGAIADSSRLALARYTGVDLEHEATELIRYQQAFQASGRVMQVASDLFDTLLGIR